MKQVYLYTWHVYVSLWCLYILSSIVLNIIHYCSIQKGKIICLLLMLYRLALDCCRFGIFLLAVKIYDLRFCCNISCPSSLVFGMHSHFWILVGTCWTYGFHLLVLYRAALLVLRQKRKSKANMRFKLTNHSSNHKFYLLILVDFMTQGQGCLHINFLIFQFCFV